MSVKVTVMRQKLMLCRYTCSKCGVVHTVPYTVDVTTERFGNSFRTKEVSAATELDAEDNTNQAAAFEVWKVNGYADLWGFGNKIKLKNSFTCEKCGKVQSWHKIKKPSAGIFIFIQLVSWLFAVNHFVKTYPTPTGQNLLWGCLNLLPMAYYLALAIPALIQYKEVEQLQDDQLPRLISSEHDLKDIKIVRRRNRFDVIKPSFLMAVTCCATFTALFCILRVLVNATPLDDSILLVGGLFLGIIIFGSWNDMKVYYKRRKLEKMRKC